MSTISANELKTRGISAIETVLKHDSEAVISIRGKDRFVVMNMEHYHHLRECELEAALAESRVDIAEGRYVKATAIKHLEKIKKMMVASKNK